MGVLKYKDPSTGEWLPVSYAEGGGGVEMELLWENASPDSQFNAQTVPLQLENDDEVVIEYYASIYIDAYVELYRTRATKVGEYGSMVEILGNAGTISGVVIIQGMTFAVGNTGVTFSGTMQSRSGATWASTTNTVVPYRIYKVKGVAYA